MRLWVVLFACVVCARGAVADDGWARCSVIADSLARLTCYDTVAKTIAPSEEPAAPTIPGIGGWEIDETASPLDDSPIIVGSLNALDTMGSGVIGNRNSALIVRCKSNETDAFVSASSYLGSDSMKASVRLDKLPPEDLRWQPAVDGKAAFVPQPIPFIKKLMEHKSLVVKLNAYDGAEETSQYDLTGIEIVVERVRKACHW